MYEMLDYYNSYSASNVGKNLGNVNMNNGNSISVWYDNPVESWNKYVHAFQSGVAAKACQWSIKEYNHDIFCQMLINSNPVISSKKSQSSCSICEETGHTARAAKHRNKQVDDNLY